MHSALLMMANRRLSWIESSFAVPLAASGSVERLSRRAFVIEVFPVASRPCRMMFRHGAARTWRDTCVSVRQRGGLKEECLQRVM